MLTLFCHLKNTKNHPAFIQKLNWTDEKIQESKSRLVSSGLLSCQTYDLKFDRVHTFLTEAISFWWPSKPQIKAKGMSLPFPLKALDLKNKHSDVFVWPNPLTSQNVEGLIVEPLFFELPELAMQDQDLRQFFSLVEFLRFVDHPVKSSAKVEMVEYLKGLSRIHNQNFPSVGEDVNDFSQRSMDQLVRFVCQNGFKDLTLIKASQVTSIPLNYFVSRWDSDQSLRLWISSESHQEFYQYLAPLIGNLSIYNKGHLAMVLEKYLDYIESHEAYYRILLWGYLENDPTLQEMNRRSQLDYFETIFTLFKKSKPEAQKSAEFYSYLFTTIWKLYASFVWCDSKTLAHKVDLNYVRTQLRRFVIESVFETF